MNNLLILGVVLLAGVTIYLILQIKKKALRKKLANTPLDEKYIELIKKEFPLSEKLPQDLKSELYGKIQIFLYEKNFEGAGGLEITDEIRVSIAAQACFLLLNRDIQTYPHLVSIVVYPGAYKHKGQDIPGIINNGEQNIAGESWGTDLVVLAWNQVERGAINMHDGQNVVFHEFAHQLDSLDGKADGIPILENRKEYKTWGKVLGEKYGELLDEIRTHKKTFMDPYGATNPAEFFAVATETFFEKPAFLLENHPTLYEEMKIYYHQDPVKYFE